MTTSCIAVMAPGDMGHAVGKVLGDHGHDVITCLAGRSDRTRALAAKGNFRDVPDLEALVTQADLILSILPPANAIKQAQDTAPMTALDGQGITVIDIGDTVGRASGLKMAYAGLTKGTNALHTAVLMLAQRLDLFDELIGEFEDSQQAALKNMRARVQRLPADAGRWVREMGEIADTYREAGLPGGFHDAAADIFRILDATPFGAETRETIDPDRTMEASIPVYVDHINAKSKDAADD